MAGLWRVHVLLAAAVLQQSGGDDVAQALGTEAGEDGCPDALRLLQRKQSRSVSEEMEDSRATAYARVVDCAKSEALDLSGSRITSWPFAAEVKCPKLQRLDLSGNFLKELPDDAFAGMPNLASLRLSYNRLRKFPNTTGLAQLWELDLRSNAISTLPPGALFDNPEVVSLDLSRNLLRELPSSDSWLPQPNSLDYLTVADNQISALGTRLFRRFSDLDWLDLSGNRLGLLETESLDGIEDLDNLLLIGNPLECRIPIAGSCFCAGDCSANSTAEDKEDDADDGTLLKVPALWCELPMCINGSNSSQDASNTQPLQDSAPQKNISQIPLNGSNETSGISASNVTNSGASNVTNSGTGNGTNSTSVWSELKNPKFPAYKL